MFLTAFLTKIAVIDMEINFIVSNDYFCIMIGFITLHTYRPFSYDVTHEIGAMFVGNEDFPLVQ